MTIDAIYTAESTATGGGRDGNVKSTDGLLDLAVRPPKEMGGSGEGVNPELLFSAGYAACFGGALEFVASQHKKDVKGAVVTCTTSVGPREGGGFGIEVSMHVKVPTLSTAEAEVLVNETHEKVCPYSHATRGNIDVTLVTEGTH